MWVGAFEEESVGLGKVEEESVCCDEGVGVGDVSKLA